VRYFREYHFSIIQLDRFIIDTYNISIIDNSMDTQRVGSVIHAAVVRYLQNQRILPLSLTPQQSAQTRRIVDENLSAAYSTGNAGGDPRELQRIATLRSIQRIQQVLQSGQGQVATTRQTIAEQQGMMTDDDFQRIVNETVRAREQQDRTFLGGTTNTNPLLPLPLSTPVPMPIPAPVPVEDLRIQSQSSLQSLSITPPNPNNAFADLRQSQPSIPNLTVPPGATDSQLAVQRLRPDSEYLFQNSSLIFRSADRDWTRSDQTRYDFTVKFGGETIINEAFMQNLSGNFLYPRGATDVRRMGSATITSQFKNIQEIEITGIVLPNERLETFIQIDGRRSGGSVDCSFGSSLTTLTMNALQYPYIIVRVDPLIGDTFSTTPSIRQSFGAFVFKEAYGINSITPADPASTKSTTPTIPVNDARGYFLMKPAHGQATKVFFPTPMSDIRSFKITICNPEGEPLSVEPDAFDVSQISTSPPCIMNDQSGNPLFLRVTLTQPFHRENLNIGERVRLNNIQLTSASPTGTQIQLLNFLNRPSGHLVHGILRPGSGDVQFDPILDSSGSNYGYYQELLIPLPTLNPRTQSGGRIIRQLFDGETSSSFTSALALSSGSLVNVSQQSTVFMNIKQRIVDSTPDIRPENI
jgi:hypothetical protein